MIQVTGSQLHKSNRPLLHQTRTCQSPDGLQGFGAHLVRSILMDCMATLGENLHLKLSYRTKKVRGAAFN